MESESSTIFAGSDGDNPLAIQEVEARFGPA
jgi:hypothetical protein